MPSLERLLQDGLVNILFVGRIAPNKKIEDHIRLAEHYKRYVDIYYRFIFVGRYDAVPRLLRAVRALIAEYQMLPDRFWFTGPVPDEELAAYYRNAHAYVSLSEHEGFCVPLVEAMAMDVPVLAYAAAAVPGDARRRGRVVRAEGSGAGGGAARRADLRRAAPAGRARRPAPPRADFGRDRLAPRLQAMLEVTSRENRLHRPTLRHRDPRRLRISLPA